MIHEVIAVGPLQCNCSVLGDEATREAIVVDPGDEIERIVAILERHHLRLVEIVITHGHIDHIAGAMRLKSLTGAPIRMHEGDLPQLKMLELQAAWVGMKSPGKVSLDLRANDQDRVRAGGIEGLILHTPGHTEGSCCLYLPGENKLMAGDTLFSGSIGRTDLPGGDFDKIMSSLHRTVLALPDEVMVTPGHGPQTTIGEERQSNPFLTDNRYKPKMQQ